eukprot:TRINITY_DN5539_c0_g1_i1.p4 TRINITY_DN5539_c0_g1~~TRINITY_DN5539_c0_g1_i1.p4  ORF type:complete len:50 (+),score=7.15 TRINITY_DN5539_c0_g1_i1:241-390(+)
MFSFKVLVPAVRSLGPPPSLPNIIPQSFLFVLLSIFRPVPAECCVSSTF